MFFVLVLPFEDVTLCEVLGCADQKPLIDEEIARLRLGDADEEGHDFGDQAELLDAVLPLPRMSTIRNA